MTLTRHDTVLTWSEPSPGPLRGILVVLPGRGEGPEVYERFGRRLATDAYRTHAVAAPSDSAETALEQLLEVFAAAEADTPLIVVGSDAGAAYAAHLAAKAAPSGDSALGGAAALVLAGLPTSASSSASTSAASTSQADSGSTPSWEDELEVRTQCPTHRGRISAAGVRRAELFSALPAEWFDPTAPARIRVPVLGLHGREDSLSPVEAARRWYAEVPQAELTTIVGGRHDALNDQTHRTVAATVVLFLERLRLSTTLGPIAVTESPRKG